MTPSPKPEDAGASAASGEAPPSSPPSGGDWVRLEMRVEELERRLTARNLALETEIRGKERLRARIEELTRRVAELEETAANLHREAVSATSLSKELDEALRVASQARAHLEAALQAESIRREAAEKELGELRPEMDAVRSHTHLAVTEATKKLEAELRDARRMLQVSRQKIDGHETHIDSLRSEVAEARQSQLETEKLRADLEARALAAEEKARAAMRNAEAIRSEGVEAFEKARESELELQRQGEKFRRESAGLESLKNEIRVSAEREMQEMRRSLEAERARMYQDLESERLSVRALERKEVPMEPRRGDPRPAPQDPAPAAKDTEPPSAREPWQVTDELRLTFRIAFWVGLFAVMIASVLFLQR